MKSINPKNIKVCSSLFHGALAGIVVFTLLVLIAYAYTHELLILWGAAVLCGAYFGWVFGSWYIPIKGERWFYEPYVVTPIISLLSAVTSALLFMFITEIGASAQNLFNLRSVVAGIFIGIYAFILTLPVTVIAGLVVAFYLHKGGGLKHAP